jgi:glycosyltransferase involved in cell wall biosynthesis
VIDAQQVSVVVPAYNHQLYIEEAIYSVLNQTCAVSEIVIVDDGSKDKTGAICSDLANRFKFIKYFKQSNLGAHNTLNRGIEEAAGTYIAVLNSDDCFMPDKITRCLRLVDQDPSIDLICGHVRFIDSKGNVQDNGITIDWQKRAYEYLSLTQNLPISILNENFITTTSNMFFKKELWKKNGGFQPLRYCHDLDFLMASFRNGKFFFDKDITHIKYRVHSTNTIKENLSKIRVEIAAVMAVTFVLDKTSLIPRSDITLDHFKKCLKNKNLSDVTIVLMMLFLSLGDRKLFYECLLNDDAKKYYSILLD